MDKRAPGEKKKTATTTLKASSTRDTLETRDISVVRWRIRNLLVQVERLSCNLCAISYDRSRFILSPAPQRNATVLFSTRSPRLQTVTGVRLSRYSCLVIPEGRPTIKFCETGVKRLGLLCMIRSTLSFNIQHLPVIVRYTVYVDTRCFYDS